MQTTKHSVSSTLLTCMLFTFIVSLSATQVARAEAPGGPDCGWGNMLFQGDKGVVPHTAAYLTNGLTSFNAFFGILFASNGCKTDGVLTYDGVPMLGLNHMLDELAQDIALGSGEALNALSVALKIEKQDRDYFDSLMHENFALIFENENMEALHVMQNIQDIVKHDPRLKHYLA